MRLLPYDPYDAVSPVENMVWDGAKPAIYWGIVDPVDEQSKQMRRDTYSDTEGDV